MVPSLESSLLLLTLLLACDGPSVAIREPTPAPVLAAAASPPRAHARRDRAAAPRPVKAASAAATSCPPDSALTYRSFGDGFLRTWCTGCHSSTLPADARQGAPEGVDFDRAALYRPHAQAVYERAVVEAHALAVDPTASASPMPPAGLVPEADRRRLAQWIACGSPGA